MTPFDLIPTALAEIAELLCEEHLPKHARDIEELRDAALSLAPWKQEFFRSEITRNKWYWLGMGTIADICPSDRKRHHRFIQAYFDLANACEAVCLSSIYSRDVLQI